MPMTFAYFHIMNSWHISNMYIQWCSRKYFRVLAMAYGGKRVVENVEEWVRERKYFCGFCVSLGRATLLSYAFPQ